MKDRLFPYKLITLGASLCLLTSPGSASASPDLQSNNPQTCSLSPTDEVKIAREAEIDGAYFSALEKQNLSFFDKMSNMREYVKQRPSSLRTLFSMVTKHEISGLNNKNA